MRIRWTELAVRDFTQICDYIEEHRSAATARRVALSIHQGVEVLSKFPSPDELAVSRRRGNLCLLGCLTLLFTGYAEIALRFCPFSTAHNNGREVSRMEHNPHALITSHKRVEFIPKKAAISAGTCAKLLWIIKTL